MIYAMLNSFVCLLWAFVMIGIVMFIFSMIFGIAVASFFQTLDLSDSIQVERAIKINEHFGSSHETMISLFAAFTGGENWMLYGALLRMLDEGELFFMTKWFATFQDDEKRINQEVRKIFQDADQ
ncbi:unnamed protein product, partial [Polarella glacialis]